VFASKLIKESDLEGRSETIQILGGIGLSPPAKIQPSTI
jgi:hypothetical protein